MEKTISRQDIRECLEALKLLPDFDRLPLPKYIHEEFNIPMTGYITKTLSDYLNAHAKAMAQPGGEPETVIPKDTQLREMPTEYIPIEVTSRIVSDTPSQPDEMSSPSTGSNTTENQPNQDPPNSPAVYGAEDTTDDESHSGDLEDRPESHP